MVKNNIFFEALFNRDISSPGTKEFLTSLAEEHPYFTPARFFLLKQTSKNTGEFNNELSKTSLLFNNNYWLNYLLLSTEENKLTETESNVYATEEYNEEVLQEENETEVITTIEESIVSTPPAIEEPPIIEEITEAYTEVIEEEIQLPQQESMQEQPEVSVEEEIATSVNEKETENIEGGEPVAGEEPVLNFQKINLAADTKEDVLIFEPLHTTDYFASVGIKLSDEVKPADKLGHQLKSFTEWLKTMKKVHSAPQLNTTAEAEQQIQQLAEKSNVNGDVVTESMADVLAQQGRVDQAIGMLEKLSLLNPLKSAYFAAKIKTLKEQ